MIKQNLLFEITIYFRTLKPIIVDKKTVKLKLATRNLKNIELISASMLNSLSLLKAKQIILTPISLNLIKEIYCE